MTICVRLLSLDNASSIANKTGIPLSSNIHGFLECNVVVWLAAPRLRAVYLYTSFILDKFVDVSIDRLSFG